MKIKVFIFAVDMFIEVFMNISPANLSIQILASSVNPVTEQLARDNRVREKIVPAKELSAVAAETAITQEERQLKKLGWDLSEHPQYSEQQFEPQNADSDKDEGKINSSQSSAAKGYHFVSEKLVDSRSVIAHRYENAAEPHETSDVEVVI